MRYLHIVWRNMMRRKIRTIFTLLSIFVTFVLFGYLMAIRSAFSRSFCLSAPSRATRARSRSAPTSWPRMDRMAS